MKNFPKELREIASCIINNGQFCSDDVVVLRQAADQMDEDIKFRKEWSERFGFLAVQNERDSLKSIDEVATILYNNKKPRKRNSKRSGIII